MGTQRHRTFSYEILDQKFTEATCTVESIDLPDIQRSSVVSVSQAEDPAPLNFHTTERQEIVNFTVTYIPHDTSEGKALLPFVKEAVEHVLKKNYKPAVAIIQLKRNAKVEHETKINDCIITGGEISISESNNVHIIFYLQGLLDTHY